MKIRSFNGRKVSGACSIDVGCLTVSISNVFDGGEIAVFNAGNCLRIYSATNAKNIVNAIRFAQRYNAKIQAGIGE